MRGKPVDRVVVFDFDGTLADTWRDLAFALNRTLAEVDLPAVEGPQVKAWIGDGALKFLATALPEAERAPERLEAHFDRFRAHYDRCCLETSQLYPGMLACLDALASERLAILSNKPARFLDRMVEGLGIRDRFGAVVGGDTLAVRKPDPRVLAEVVNRVGVDPDELWIVGDSGVDIETGRAGGARTIGVGWGLRGRDELRATGAEFIVESAAEIAPLILNRATSSG